MKATRFKLALHHIHYGNLLFFVSLWNMIRTHKLLTALVFSLAANFVLAFSLLNARGERDRYNKTAYQYEQKVDSLNIIIGKE